MDTDLLFLLTNKFRNKRVVRNIYEHHTGTRKYWLEQYRYCINNGYVKNKCSKYKWPASGVRTFQLAGDRFCHGTNHTKCYPGLHAHRGYPPICWELRIKGAEYNKYHYLMPKNMKFAAKKYLWIYCVENNLDVPKFYTPVIDKICYIKLLMSL